MADIQTVFVLDKNAAAAFKALGGDNAIIVPLTSVAHLRALSARASADVWLCDLSMEGLNFEKDAARLTARNPGMRTVLTGPLSVASAAQAQVRKGAALAFVSKPWRLLPLRQAVLRGEAADSETPRRASPQLAELAAAARAANQTRPGRSAPHPVTPTGRHGALHAAAAAPAQTSEARYQLEELLGEGGVGQVWRARDLLLEIDVAVKVLRADFVRDPEAIAALKREALICMQLTHPHIVRVFEFGQRRDTYFLVMEYIRGRSLHALFGTPALRQPQVVTSVAAAMASALDYAHRRGVLHNDLTPGNVLIDGEGCLKLIDFGIATAVRQKQATGEFIFGTPDYMSPEQLRGDATIGPATDLFSLGVLLCQMLTGHFPHPAGATPELLATRPRAPVTDVSAGVGAVLDRALAFDPAQRWSSARELVDALAAALKTKVES